MMNTLTRSSRRTVLKTGAAIAGLAAFGLPARGALAANGTRPDINSPAGQAMVQLYSKAVGLMKDPAINNPPQPQSWSFQAYIHNLPYRVEDPQSPGYRNGSLAFKAKVDSIYGVNPSGPAAEWKKAALACWSTCPHGSPNFLPWHRWYMFYFEQVVRSVLNDQSFMLPYWNYASNDSSSLQLPSAFVDTTSPLFESIRGNGFSSGAGTGAQNVPMNGGGYMPYSQTDYNPSLQATVYFPADVGNIHFPPDPAWTAYGYTGRTETQPHDFVHVNVGGLMGNVPTAAHDPVFYVHHCQIDRLWASWQSYAGSTMNFAPPGKGTSGQPDQATWDSQSYSFVDGTGALVTVTNANAVNYQQLGYSYQTLAPQPSSGPQVAAASAVMASTGGTATAAIASRSGVSVGAGGTTVTLETPKAAAAAPASGAPSRVLLKDVKLRSRPPAPLHVFVNLPAGTAPSLGGPYHAGLINSFKLEAESESGNAVKGAHAGHHGGEGDPDFSFHIAPLLEAQRRQGLWSGGAVTVTIATLGVPGTAGSTYLVIGAIELYP